MKKLVVSVMLMALSQNIQAEAGKCYATGRVGGEGQVCAKYNNTDATTCKHADGWAWCGWEPEVKVQGTGPLAVDCTTAQGEVKKYRVNRIVFTGKSEVKSLVALGSGPNRQDDGLIKLEGECHILPAKMSGK